MAVIVQLSDLHLLALDPDQPQILAALVDAVKHVASRQPGGVDVYWPLKIG